MASLFSGKVNEVKLKINPSKKGIEFFSQNQDLGESNSFLAGQIKGAPLEISFNNRFLASGLTNIKSSEVIFGLNKEDSPAVLKPLGDPSYLYVVMPIKI
jgi:DNA polymerase-3 subunit beta